MEITATLSTDTTTSLNGATPREQLRCHLIQRHGLREYPLWSRVDDACDAFACDAYGNNIGLAAFHAAASETVIV